MRYVVLHHTGMGDAHFDWMVETSPGSMLATWRVERWPVEVGDLLKRIGDHRRAYLEYEGEISGGRGRVRRVEAGEMKVEVIDERRWRMVMAGERAITIERQVDGVHWRVEFGADSF